MEDDSYATGSGKRWVWLYVVIAVILAGGVYYYYQHKGTSSSSTGGLYGSAATATPATPASSASPASGVAIMTETDPSAGPYLADSSGKTLYTYSGDTPGVSNCAGSCIANWPMYAASDTATLPANLTVITRSDGSKQYAYKGMPLYYFVGDSGAGQVTGNGEEGFSLAKP